MGGRLADWLGAGASLWAFKFAELLVGAFGLISKPLYYDVLLTRASAVSHHYDAAGIDIIAILSQYVESVPLSFGPDDSRTLIDVNTDTFPRDEFALPF